MTGNDHDLPPTLERDPGADGARVELPPRGVALPGGRAAMTVGILLLLGWLVASFLLESTGCYAVFCPLLGGLFLAAPFVARHASTAVEVANGRLRVVERLGGFGVPRTRRLDDLVRFEVEVVRPGSSGPGWASGEKCGAVIAHFARQSPLRFASGYPHDRACALARSLAAHLEVPVDPASIGSEHVAEVEPAERLDLEHPPPGSRVTLERNVTGLVVTLPPVGVFGGAKLPTLFALGWSAIVGAAMYGTLTADNPRDGIPLAVLIPFAIVGLGLLLVAIHLGRRRVAFAMVQGDLLVRRVGPLRTKSEEFPGGEIESIVVGPSGGSTNGRPDMQVQVHMERLQRGFGSGRDAEELRWIAAVLDDERRRSQVSGS